MLRANAPHAFEFLRQSVDRVIMPERNRGCPNSSGAYMLMTTQAHLRVRWYGAAVPTGWPSISLLNAFSEPVRR